jgi:hypothetical protein
MMYEFHSNLDKINPTLFGQALDDQGNMQQITADQRERRDRAFAMADQMARNLQESGRSLPPMLALQKRAVAAEFSQEILEDKSNELKTNLRAQSAKRRPVGTSRAVPSAPPPPGSSINDRVSHITSDPAFNKLFNQLEAEAGAR